MSLFCARSLPFIYSNSFSWQFNAMDSLCWCHITLTNDVGRCCWFVLRSQLSCSPKQTMIDKLWRAGKLISFEPCTSFRIEKEECWIHSCISRGKTSSGTRLHCDTNCCNSGDYKQISALNANISACTLKAHQLQNKTHQCFMLFAEAIFVFFCTCVHLLRAFISRLCWASEHKRWMNKIVQLHIVPTKSAFNDHKNTSIYFHIWIIISAQWKTKNEHTHREKGREREKKRLDKNEHSSRMRALFCWGINQWMKKSGFYD